MGDFFFLLSGSDFLLVLFLGIFLFLVLFVVILVGNEVSECNWMCCV